MKNRSFISLSKSQLKELVNHCDGFIPYHFSAIEFYQMLNKKGEYDERIRRLKKKLKFFVLLKNQSLSALDRLK